MTAKDVISGEAPWSAECGDNLPWLRSLPPACVDLIFTSPPYEAARTYGIDFNLRGQEWADWCVERFAECCRVCRGLVAWVVEGQTRDFRWSAAPILMMAELHRRGIRLRKPPAFARVGIPGSGGQDWLRNDYEFIVCATPGKLPWSDNTACGHPPKWAPGGEMSNRLSDGSRVNQWGKCGTEAGVNGNAQRTRDGRRQKAIRPSHKMVSKGDLGDGYKPPAKANPGNIIRCNVGGGLMGSDLAHENEAPFPESLVEFFVLSFCPPNGIVCDPHGGSGTTLAVAHKNGRRAIGCDVRQSQIDLIGRRMATVQPELFA